MIDWPSVCLLVASCALVFGEASNSTKGQACSSANTESDYLPGLTLSATTTAFENMPSQCSMFIAPSSIPGAGWGIYTGIDLDAGTSVGDTDVVIPILDKYKTLPYRGQQRFPSWLRYIWPDKAGAFYHSDKSAFPSIPKRRFPDEGLNAATGLEWYDLNNRKLSVFSPGLASLANSHQELVNIDVSEEHASFVTVRKLEAGSEFLLDYGSKWHSRFEARESSEKEYATLAEYYKYYDFSNLPTETDKRAQLNEKTMRKSKKKKKKKKKLLQRDVEEEEPEEDEVHVVNVRSQEWLRKNGICVDNLTSESSNDAGRRAFAKRHLNQGEIIAPAPLLALKREDLVMYEVDESSSTYRNTLKVDKVVGQEFLLNYCYGHPDSQLLLVPYSPVVNLIQHSSEEPNAKIQWSSEQDFLDLHPIDVLDLSGRLRMDFVALRDIEEGEEILIDYGSAWESAARAFDGDVSDFRHERGVNEGFFPDHWLNTSVKYELAQLDTPLQPGELRPMVWKHNGKPVVERAWRVGLPDHFSDSMENYSKELGVIGMYEDLLYNDDTKLGSNDWFVFNASDSSQGQWFAQKYMSTAWKFDMHYVAAWDEPARVSFLKGLDDAGFQVALETMGSEFGLHNLTCFHASFMGLTECDNSFTHTDVYATGEVAFNVIFPIIVVPNSAPELDIQSDDANVVVSVNYEYNTAVVMGDWGYHKTSPIDYNDSGQMRVVVGMYCAQMSDQNKDMLAHIYDGEDPAPFMNQFKELKEVHWSKDGRHSLRRRDVTLD